jgi:hypothetical protein
MIVFNIGAVVRRTSTASEAMRLRAVAALGAKTCGFWTFLAISTTQTLRKS